MRTECDILVVGAGTAGLPTAIEAARAGARVCLIERSDRIGGTLHVSAGQMSGAGTRRQRERGITDTPDAHFDDVMRISKGKADPVLARLAVTLNPGTIDWLMDEGFAMHPPCPEILHFHEAYHAARTYWGVEGGRSVLAVLTRLLAETQARTPIDLRFGTRLTGLVKEGGAVTAARIEGPDGAAVIAARKVVLATGGYGASSEMFAALNHLPLFTCCVETSTGDGLDIGVAAGGMLRGAEYFLPTFGGIEDAAGTGRVLWDDLPLLTPQARPPWEIYVNAAGARFVAEDHESVDARERALLEQPEMTFWIVFDEAIRRQAPTLLPGWTAERVAAAWNAHGSFARADTIEGLARQAGVDASGLAGTVAAYNAGLAAADPFGRRHRPAPITAPPFYAIKAHGIVLKTPAGLTVDGELRVTDREGRPIPNLYALGEAIGGATLSGNAFVGGMSVTPALGFGRWLGARLAAEIRTGAAA